MKQIALIEDDRRILNRMVLFLNKQEELECVIAAGSLAVFFECLSDERQPDLLLLDIELSEAVNTIAHLPKIKSLLPHVKVLVITGHNHPDYLLQALQQGADSFYLKGSGLPKLLVAINATFSGGAYLDPKAAVHVIPYLRGKDAIPDDGLPDSGMSQAPASEGLGQGGLKLSFREDQVARGLIKGQTYKEIAESINLSVNTVRHYVKVLYKKFGVGNKVQLGNKLKPYT